MLSDTGKGLIRKISPDGIISPLAADLRLGVKQASPQILLTIFTSQTKRISVFFSSLHPAQSARSQGMESEVTAETVDQQSPRNSPNRMAWPWTLRAICTLRIPGMAESGRLPLTALSRLSPAVGLRTSTAGQPPRRISFFLTVWLLTSQETF